MKEIIIGDLHGDWKVWRKILHHSHCINDRGEWIGKRIRLIQLGDIFDRGGRNVPYEDADEEWDILSDLIRYQKEAPKHHSEVYFLIGNHEWMNVLGHFYFVSPKAIKNSMNYYQLWKQDPTFQKNQKKNGRKLAKTPEEARLRLMEPGSPIAQMFAHYGRVFLKIDDRIYVHAGLMPIHSRISTNPEEINRVFMKMCQDEPLTTQQEREIYQVFFLDSTAIWVNRAMGLEMLSQKEVNQILQDYQARKIFVGHTPQFQTGIRSIYNGKVFLCDSGRYEAYGLRNQPEPKIQYATYDPVQDHFQVVEIPLA